MKFHAAARKILTADRKIVKIFDRDDGKLFTNVETKTSINDIELCGDSGLLFIPQEQKKIGTFFIPSLGHAPKWCAFLENLTEEMEESKEAAGTVYEDYKFLTANDLHQLNATHLIGTPMLKAYMHGYFIEMRAYQKLLQVADPFAFERYRKEQITQKLNDMREKRINVKTKTNLPKVNKEFFKEALESTKGGKSSLYLRNVESLMKDDRFSKLFQDKDFAIDKNSEAYKLLKPNPGKQ